MLSAEDISTLQIEDLDEEHLKDHVIIPYLKKKFPRSEVKDVCGKKEYKHYCDIIISHFADSEKKERVFREGIQLKTKFTIPRYTDAKIKQIIARIKYGIEYKSLDRFYFITNSSFEDDTNVEDYIEDGISKLGYDYKRKISFWDIGILKKELRNESAETLPQIADLRIPSLLEEQKRFDNQPFFAAYYSFQIFLLHVKAKKKLDALSEIKKAKGYIKNSKKYSSFHRVLMHFYEQWEFLIKNNQHVEFNAQGIPFVRNGQPIENLLERQYPETYPLLNDIQYILNQVFLLRTAYTNTPSGLSSLVVCRLLLRLGIPPLREMAMRIERLQQELKSENDKSIDGECSMCTGVAYSILGLANKNNHKVFSWLKGLKSELYINLEERSRHSKSSEHSMQYTASVLLGFIDNNDEIEIEDCLSCFFTQDHELSEEEFYYKWLKHRNITEADAYSYVSSSFLYYILLKGKSNFTEMQKKIIRFSIDKLIKYLDNSSDNHDATWRQYETRDNICSFALSIMIGYDNERAMHFLLENIVSLREYIFQTKGNWLLDSNVDRTRKRLEGWLVYWETLLFLKENGQGIQKYIPEKTTPQLHN